jgi:hypothetical protein
MALPERSQYGCVSRQAVLRRRCDAVPYLNNAKKSLVAPPATITRKRRRLFSILIGWSGPGISGVARCQSLSQCDGFSGARSSAIQYAESGDGMLLNQHSSSGSFASALLFGSGSLPGRDAHLGSQGSTLGNAAGSPCSGSCCASLRHAVRCGPIQLHAAP